MKAVKSLILLGNRWAVGSEEGRTWAASSGVWQKKGRVPWIRAQQTERLLKTDWIIFKLILPITSIQTLWQFHAIHHHRENASGRCLGCNHNDWNNINISCTLANQMVHRMLYLSRRPVNYILWMSVNYTEVGPESETSPPLLLSLSAQTSPIFPQCGESISPTHRKEVGSKNREQRSDFQKLRPKILNPAGGHKHNKDTK